MVEAEWPNRISSFCKPPYIHILNPFGKKWRCELISCKGIFFLPVTQRWEPNPFSPHYISTASSMGHWQVFSSRRTSLSSPCWKLCFQLIIFRIKHVLSLLYWLSSLVSGSLANILEKYDCDGQDIGMEDSGRDVYLISKITN